MMEGRKRLRFGGLILLLGSMMGLASATSHQGQVTDLIASTFLPQGAQLTGPQGIIFGVFLPWLIFWVLLYVGMQKAGVFERNANIILSIAISLFIIPTGGYRLIAQFFFLLGGFGAGGLPVPGVEGVSYGPFQGVLTWFNRQPQVIQAIIASTVVGGFVGFILNMGKVKSPAGEGEEEGGGRRFSVFGTAGFSGFEYLVLTLFMGATFLAFGGLSSLLAAAGWIILLFISLMLIEGFVEAGGGGPALGALLVAVMLVGWLFRAEVFPPFIRNAANVIVGTISGLLLLAILLAIGWVIFAVSTQ